MLDLKLEFTIIAGMSFEEIDMTILSQIDVVHFTNFTSLAASSEKIASRESIGELGEIMRDVIRTSPFLLTRKFGQSGLTMLGRILMVLATTRADIGYCQVISLQQCSALITY